MTWSDESISYHADHTATRSELRPGIVKRAIDGSTTQMEMNPNLYFSEGQLSALSVAALLAASTTFGWSRWKGLLLDDPLQHNDVIHASAFMDLLRQLVNGLGYQIILSTHDSSEAEFLSRKCRSAGIPYQIHELAPRGEEGLVLMRDRLSNVRAVRNY
jgi:exonuclease SbcC